MPSNPMIMWEIASNDQERSIEFLREVFDWDIELDQDLGFYFVPANSAEKEQFYGGAVFTLKKARLPFLTVYFRVDDIEQKARVIRDLGGLIIEEPHEVAGGSKICLFNEPAGVTLAMIQPRSKRADERESA